MPPPSATGLIEITKNVKQRRKVYGVFQGARIHARELTYHIMWPPRAEAEILCWGLFLEIRRKLDKALERCRKRHGDACIRVLETARQEGADMAELLEPNHVVG